MGTYRPGPVSLNVVMESPLLAQQHIPLTAGPCAGPLWCSNPLPGGLGWDSANYSPVQPAQRWLVQLARSIVRQFVDEDRSLRQTGRAGGIEDVPSVGADDNDVAPGETGDVRARCV